MRFVIEVELGENKVAKFYDETKQGWVKEPEVQFEYLKTIEGYLNTLMAPLLTKSIPGKIISIESGPTYVYRDSYIDFMTFE